MGNYYLIHSQGPWKKHKYAKKVGNRYYYGSGNGDMVDITDRLITKDGKNNKVNVTNKSSDDQDKTTKSSKKSSKNSSTKKDTTKTTKEATAKSSKGGGGSGSKKSEKEAATKTTKTEEKKEQKTLVAMAKEAIASKYAVKDDDSVSVSMTDKGTYRVLVDHADGTSDTFTLDSSFKLVDEDEVKHSEVLYWNNEDGLYHHGIIGQKWGIRRYQNADGTLTNLGRKRVSNKYQNIDGSLNERGIDHRYRFADKKIAKNNKYYDKQISKYNKKLDKTNDEEEKLAIKSRIDNAERTRQQVNKYIANMEIDDIVSIENEAKQRVMNIVGTATGVAAATGLGIAAPRYVAKGLASAGNFLSSIDPEQTVESIQKLAETETGSKALKYVDAGIRGYADVRAYVISTAVDQAINRMEQNGTFDRIASAAGQASGSATASIGSSVTTEINRLVKAYK